MKLSLFYICIASSLLTVAATGFVSYKTGKEIKAINKRILYMNDSLQQKLEVFNESMNKRSAYLDFDTIPGNEKSSSTSGTFVTGTKVSEPRMCIRDMVEKQHKNPDSLLYYFYYSKATGKIGSDLCVTCYERHQRICDSLQKHFNRASK